MWHKVFTECVLITLVAKQTSLFKEGVWGVGRKKGLERVGQAEAVGGEGRSQEPQEHGG